MTVNELKNTLNQAIATLQDNKAIATPQLLNSIDKIVADLGGAAPTHLAIDGSTFQVILEGITKVMLMERRLVETNMTDNLVEIMTKIQNHPILMGMIARIL